MKAGSDAYVAACRLMSSIAGNAGRGIGSCEMRRYCRLAGLQAENMRKLRQALASIERDIAALEQLSGEPANLMRYRLQEARLGITRRKAELTIRALEELVEAGKALPELAYLEACRRETICEPGAGLAADAAGGA